ncbi:hypothetical protein Pelo_1033 [Pelomyxa schiedti]|nr:hypothetical protein Pelo_1033 [Pelomyxa schiedti]
MISVVGRDDDGTCPVTAQQQALALLCCYNQPQSLNIIKRPPSSPSPLRVVPQSILRDFVQNWVLPTNRRVVLVVNNNSDEDDVIRGKHPFVTMFVVIGVSFTLGITQGPSVTWHGMTWEVVIGFLSTTVVLWCHGSALAVTDVSGGSTVVLIPGGVLTSVVHSSKWLVVILDDAKLRIWRMNQQKRFPEGEHLELDITDMKKMCWLSVPKVIMTHSQPSDCISEGDEMCIVTDERDRCNLRIFDIGKCFETKELVVTRQYSTPRAPSRSLDYGGAILRVLSDRNGGMHVVFWVTEASCIEIQNVATGQRTVLPATNNIIPVDSAHFGTWQLK